MSTNHLTDVSSFIKIRLGRKCGIFSLAAVGLPHSYLRRGDSGQIPRFLATGKTFKQVAKENVSPDVRVVTDDRPGYGGLKQDLRRHSAIRHTWKVYARKEGDVLISTNTIKGFFSILKRGINGVYHPCRRTAFAPLLERI